jgi:6-pyruvoyltetrahydropterin/6-carboxytetrahydropterin synthase
MPYRLKISDQFAAGHCLPLYKGKCERMHGHNFRVEAEVVGDELDEGGLLLDFAELKKMLAAIIDPLDHTVLNEMEPFDVLAPSSENIARVIYDSLDEKIGRDRVKVLSVTVWESDKACATYYR